MFNSIMVVIGMELSGLIQACRVLEFLDDFVLPIIIFIMVVIVIELSLDFPNPFEPDLSGNPCIFLE